MRAGDAVWAARAEAVGASVRYSLAGPDAGDFTVDEYTGQVRYARHLASDYEGNPEGWQFTVVATSSYERTAYQQVRLKLANLDEPGQVARFAGVPVSGADFTAPPVTDPDGQISKIRYQWQRYDASADKPVWADIDMVIRGGEALAFHIAGMIDDGEDLPKARTAAEIKASPDLTEWRAGAELAWIPVIIDKGSPRRVNISLDAGLLEAIDYETGRRGITRSAFLSGAARKEITLT